MLSVQNKIKLEQTPVSPELNITSRTFQIEQEVPPNIQEKST